MTPMSALGCGRVSDLAPRCGPKQNCTLIASRHPIMSARAFTDRLLARHLWCAEIDGMVLRAVYMPQKAAKLPY